MRNSIIKSVLLNGLKLTVASLSAALTVLAACAQSTPVSSRPATYQQSGHYLLKGQITGVGQQSGKNNRIYLRYTLSGNQRRLDSAVLQEGHFSFTGSISRPVRANLFLKKNNREDSRQFYLQPGALKIMADTTMSNAVVTGSPATAVQDLFTAKTVAYRQAGNLLRARLSANMGNKDSVNFLTNAQRNLYLGFRDALVATITDYPDSYASLDLVSDFLVGIDPLFIRPLFEALGQKFKQADQGQRMLEQINKAGKIMVGSMAPDFSQPDEHGTAVRLSDYLGKYVLIDFWASWCGICRMENPNLRMAYTAFKDRGFDVLGVSLDDSAHKKDWLEAVKQDDLPWKQVADLKGAGNYAATLYGIKGIPQNVLIDPKGKIVAKNLRGRELTAALMGIFDPEFNMRLDGYIDSNNSTMVVFQYYKGQTPVQDSVTIQDGKFTWLTNMDRPQPVQVVLLPQRQHLRFYSDIGYLQFLAKANALGDFTLTGSAVQMESEGFQGLLNKLSPEQENLLHKFTYASGKEQQLYAEKLADLNQHRYNVTAKKYVSDHPRSLYSLELIKSMTENPLTENDYKVVYPLFMSLDAVLRTTATGKDIAAKLPMLKRQSIGTEAFNFTQKDIEGKQVRMEDFKGKYVLLDFWASWCGPCRAENPNVLKAYNKYKSKGFTVVGVSLDADSAAWRKAVVTDKLPWCQISDLKGRENEIAAYYGVNGIPWNLLIGPDGRILAKGLRGHKLLDQLSLLLVDKPS